MPPSPSKNLLAKIANTVFANGNSKQQRKYVLALERPQIEELIPDKTKRLKMLTDIALHENAAAFKKLLGTFSDDEESILAIVKGYKADVRYNNQDFGDLFITGGDAKDLAQKEKALMEFVTQKGSTKARRKPPNPPKQ